MSEDMRRALMLSFRRTYELAENADKTGDRRAACRLYLESAEALTRAARYSNETELKEMKVLAKRLIDRAKALSDDEGADKKSDSKKPETHEDDLWFESEIPEISFDDVAGLEDVKTLVRERVIGPIRNPELYRQMKLSAGTGLMMFGPPGTGKTTVARAIAHEVGAPIAVVDCQSLVNKYLGEGEKKLHELFECARKYETCVIFFDDFETIAARRESSHEAIGRLVGQLLVELDGFKKNTNNMLLLAATNLPWVIDPALKRPGRFSEQVYISLPTEEARYTMLKMLTKGVLQTDTLDFRAYAAMSEGFSGGDMRSLADSAKMNAIRRALKEKTEEAVLTHEDFMDAFQKAHPSVTGEQLMEYKEYILENGLPMPEEM